MRKNNLSKDIYNEMLKLEQLKVKHKIITTEDEIPSFLEQAIEKLRQGYIQAIVDEGTDDNQGLSKTSKKTQGKGKSVK